MTTQTEVLKLALEALGKAKRQCQYHNIAPHVVYDDAITAIKEALNRGAMDSSPNGEAQPDQLEGLKLIHKADIDLAKKRALEVQPEHELYTDADKDKPDAICDRNGQVALAMCKKCGKAEIELDAPCVKPQPEQEPVATEQIEELRDAINRLEWDVIELKIENKKLKGAQPEQRNASEHLEPVAWYDSKTGWTDFHSFKPVRPPSAPDAEWLPLYTTPPQRTAEQSSRTLAWVGLDNDDLIWIYSNSDKVGQAISNTEAKLKEKNGV